MKNKLIFGTSNQHKINEIKSVLPPEIELVNHLEYNLPKELPEHQDTILGNAIEKAQFIYERTGQNCFAEDSGLCVDHLDGRPGVYSARYAEKSGSELGNIEVLLEQLEGVPTVERTAYFKTVIALFYDKHLHIFEGECQGNIITEKRGESGFGYDPVFIPKGHSTTFAEMGAKEKNKISHRTKATQSLINFLDKQ